MDKVLSTRLSLDAIATLEAASKRLGLTKKRFLEEAIQLRAEQPDEAEVRRRRFVEAIEASFGAWVRDESPEETVRQIKESWEKDWDRNWDAVREAERRGQDLR